MERGPISTGVLWHGSVEDRCDSLSVFSLAFRLLQYGTFLKLTICLSQYYFPLFIVIIKVH